MKPDASAPATAEDTFDSVFAIRLPPRPYPGLRPFENQKLEQSPVIMLGQAPLLVVIPLVERVAVTEAAARGLGRGRWERRRGR